MKPVPIEPTSGIDPLLDRTFIVAQHLATDDESTDWNEHEHTAPVVIVQAEVLLTRAGSPELAKHAIDVAARKHHDDPVLDDLP